MEVNYSVKVIEDREREMERESSISPCLMTSLPVRFILLSIASREPLYNFIEKQLLTLTHDLTDWTNLDVGYIQGAAK